MQLIALVYGGQHIQEIKRLLNIWLETSPYDSSEDNESNTSPVLGGNSEEPYSDDDPCSTAATTGSANDDQSDDSSDESDYEGAEDEYTRSKRIEDEEPIASM